MLRVTVEVLPGGSEKGRYTLGEIELVNISGFAASKSDYTVELRPASHTLRTQDVAAPLPEHGFVHDFPRLERSAFDLLLWALWTMLEDRNPELHAVPLG